MNQKRAKPRTAMAATPPTTPPTMAPVCEFPEEVVVAAEVLDAWEIAVDVLKMVVTATPLLDLIDAVKYMDVPSVEVLTTQTFGHLLMSPMEPW